MDLETTKAYALPGNLSAGITHGSWSKMLPEAENKCGTNILNSNKVNSRGELKYSESDIKAVEEWVKRHTESTVRTTPLISRLHLLTLCVVAQLGHLLHGASGW